MKLPADLQREFESHLQKAPEKTRAVRRRLEASQNTRATKRTSDAELLDLCDESLVGMLGGIQRKTTPLYIRLIHSAVSYFEECTEDGSPEALQKAATVIDSVASTIGREAYRIPRL